MTVLRHRSWVPTAGWFLTGVLLATFLLFTQARSLGGATGLLSVGSASPLRPLITEQLPDLIVVDGSGHDGQMSYAIALDLDGDRVAGLLDHGGYRYRRILYPAVASLFGLLKGQSLLWGLIVVTALSMGAIAAAMARLIGPVPARRWWLLAAVFANPGMWLAVRLLTADALALALALTGLALARDGERPIKAALLLGLAAVAKDQYVLVPVAVAAWLWWRRDRIGAVRYALVGVLPLLGWVGTLSVLIDGAWSPRKNLGLPFAGIVEASPGWFEIGGAEAYLAVGTLAAVVLTAAVVVYRRTTLMAWLAAPWVILAVVSSDWVWEFGNNAARAFAILVPLAVLVWLAPSVQRPPLAPRRTSKAV